VWEEARAHVIPRGYCFGGNEPWLTMGVHDSAPIGPMTVVRSLFMRPLSLSRSP
jgi:hypothetical protein